MSDEIDRIMASAIAETSHGREPSMEDMGVARFLRYQLRRAGYIIAPAPSPGSMTETNG